MNTKILKFLMQIAIINFFLFQLSVTINDKNKNYRQANIMQPKPTVTNPVNTKAPIETSTITPPQSETPTPTPKTDLFLELSKHNTPGDCWVSYQGHIYNITSFFGNHPGGDAIMVKYCGGDMVTGFDTKEKNPGSSHSTAAQNMLSQYLIQ